MGFFEREQQLIAAGQAERGWAARQYFAELDAGFSEEEKFLSHRPDYTRTLFAPEHEDIYREFCAFLDLPKPRALEDVPEPMSVEGFTAADVYVAMKQHNDRIVLIDGAAVYNMLVKLRTQPEISKRVLAFRPTCYQNGCGTKDAAFDRGCYDMSAEVAARTRVTVAGCGCTETAELCPVCGAPIEGNYDICASCGWENDPVQRREPNYAPGANKMSLNEARVAFGGGEA